MTAWETIAPVWALLQERKRFQGQRIHVFVDNVGAQFALAKGSSKVDDINGFCAAFWILAAQLRADVQFFRVSSKANPADAPSRGGRPLGAMTRRDADVVVGTAPPRAVVSGAALRDVVPDELR